MPPASRATGVPIAVYRAVGSSAKSGSKPRRTGDSSLASPAVDLATKLRVFQRTLRSRVERRDAFLDIVRAVNASLEPAKIAELLINRAAMWIPAPCWAVVSSDLASQLTVLSDHGLSPEMGPVVYAIGNWVMNRGQDFLAADLRTDTRVHSNAVGAVI